MFRLTLPMLLLAIVGSITVGCSNSQPSQPAASGLDADSGKKQAQQSGERPSGNESLASGGTSIAEQAKSANQLKSNVPRGPISVDADGYVTLENTSGKSTPATGGASNVPPSASSPSLAVAADTAPAPSSQAPTGTSPSDQSQTNKPDAKKSKTNDMESDSAAGSVSAKVASTTVNAAPKNAASSKSANPSAESGLATLDEKNQRIAEGWPKPQALLFFTGQQHGYIEPCGCTGLENQKGGINRRDTLLTSLRKRGWDVLPMDVGNFERRVGRQAEIKFQTTVEALKDMQYSSATLGVDDLKLSSTHLLALTATEGKTETPFLSANAFVLIEEYMPKSKIIEVGGRKLGITAVLGDGFKAELASSNDIVVAPAADSLRPVVAQLKKAGCDMLILLAHATLEESQELARQVPGFDLVVTAGGYPEPQYQLEEVEGSQAKMAQVGAKGMYAVMVGLYPDKDKPLRYQRVALSSQFADSPRMIERFSNYQKQLETIGLEGLGVRAQSLADGLAYVGSDKCGECHTKAFEVWKSSEHFTATESLVKPPNDRSMIPRHHDPECLSCHVTGWNPQNYYPYATGFASLEKTPNLTGNGCENCHGPGSAHAAAEGGDVPADDSLIQQLREKMRLPLAEARDQCLRCHDLDNSPEFQHAGAFEEYWQQIAHPGKD